MSRVGKKHITIPSGVTVENKDGVLTVKGPKGELKVNLPEGINYGVEDGVIALTRANESQQTRENHGTTRALLNNAVIGVSEGFKKDLEIVGIGYRAQLRGNDLVLFVGYSHEVVIKPIPGVKISVPSATEISVEGISKEAVGQVAAIIRETRKPEPYAGKGIRYKGEYVATKEGKRAGGKK